MWWDKYQSIPFVEYGRGVSGCDCWGLARLIEREEFNKNLPSYIDSYNGYGRSNGIPQAISDNVKNYVPIKYGLESSGDLVLISVSGLFVHIGVVTELGSFIHSVSEEVGVLIESYKSFKYRNRVEFCRV